MRDSISDFLNIKYKGKRFSNGRLPLDVLSDLQALEEILITFAREIFLTEKHRVRMPSGYSDWFSFALTAVKEGSAVPVLSIDIEQDEQSDFIERNWRTTLLRKATHELEEVLRAISEERPVKLSSTQVRNFNRFLPNLKQDEKFILTPMNDNSPGVSKEEILIDVRLRNNFLKQIHATYEQQVQGKARLKSVDEKNQLGFTDTSIGDFNVIEKSKSPAEYGSNIGSYFEYNLLVRRGMDDAIQEVLNIYDLSILEHPYIDVIDGFGSICDGWLDGNGKAIGESVRLAAKEFINTVTPIPPFYSIAPTEPGGILLEYQHSGWDYGLEFTPNGRIIYFGVEVSGEKEFKEEFVEDQKALAYEKIRGILKSDV